MDDHVVGEKEDTYKHIHTHWYMNNYDAQS